jgi:hypothetical protein
MAPKTRKSNQPQVDTEFRAVLNVLKRILRERGWSYRDLAGALKRSESGIKKIFAAQDCSFILVSQIAAALDLSLSDVLSEVNQAELTSTQFTKEQQAYFLNHPDAFRFFIKLLIERESPGQIQKEFGLSDAVLFKYLKTLDSFHLIRLLPKNEIKRPKLSHVRDFGRGPLLEKIYREWALEMSAEVASPNSQASGNFIIRCLKMRKETYQDLQSRLLDLEEEFLRRAIQEMSVRIEGLTPVRWISMLDQKSYVRGRL